MDRATEPNIKQQPQTSFLLQFLLFIPIVLIIIGDFVRLFIQGLIFVFRSTYSVTRGIFIEASVAIHHWTKEKYTLPKRITRYPRPPTPKLSVQNILQAQIDTLAADIVNLVSSLVGALVRLASWGKYLAGWRKILALPRIKLPRFPSLRLKLFHPAIITRPERIKPPVGPPITAKRRPTSDQIKSFFIGVVATILFVFLPYNTYAWLKSLPNPQLLSRRDLEVTTKIFDRNGTLLYEIYSDQNRTPLSLSEVPEAVKQATIAIEDRDFYRHQGISVRGIIRALREIIFNHQIQGGSTLTQQLIKSALLTPEVKISRKINEIFLAFWAERLFSKDQIMEMYLNQVPYGGTAWGIEAASQMYLGKSVRDLSLAEAALLAGLPAAPTEYSPLGNHPEKAFARQKEVIRRMLEDHYITEKEAVTAINTEIRLIPPRVPIRAPHFVMYVKSILEERYGHRLVARGGLRVMTSLDIAAQEKIEDIVKTHINALARLRVGNGAALVTNPKTGEILAMVGSKDYFNLKEEGNVNVTSSLRQPGSSIKVVNYAAALENGFTAASLIEDSPVVYNVPGSPPYAPVNYDGKFHGTVPLRYALGNSYNVPAVKVLAKIGVAAMIEKGRLMGIESWQDDSRFGLSLTLGGGEVTMLEMAKAYGALANGGNRTDLTPILEVTDYTGRVIERARPKESLPAVKPEVAWILSNIISDNAARSAAFGASSSLVIPGKTVSVKTGTSNDKRDNWTIGYTPSFVTVVWVGNNNNTPMDPYLTSGVTGAAPIWHDIMVELLKDKADEIPAKPMGVVSLPCYYNRQEYFVLGTEPTGGSCVPLPTPTPTAKP